MASIEKIVRQDEMTPARVRRDNVVSIRMGDKVMPVRLAPPRRTGLRGKSESTARHPAIETLFLAAAVAAAALIWWSGF